MSDNVVDLKKAKPRAGKSRPAPANDDGWMSELRRTGKGDVKKTLANVITILVKDPRWTGVIAYDAFGECVVSTRPPPTRPQDTPSQPKAGEWTDEGSIRTATWLASEYDIDAPTTMVDQAIAAVAMRNVTHPVKDYLHALVWDGTERLDAMLVTYFGAPDTPYVRGVGSRWMISAVARVYRPGCQADCTLIAESRTQGTGKSTAFEALASAEWFADTGITPGDKDSYQGLRRKWIYELGELGGIKGREVERVKNFLSARSDNYRPSYGRRNRDFPRQCVFAATTNDTQYLADKTGNRRFWPVKTGTINVAGLRLDRDQLWAEATARYNDGAPWHVNTTEFAALCANEQTERTHDDPWIPVVAAWMMHPTATMPDPKDGAWVTKTLDLSKGVLTVEVLAGALRMKVADITRADEMRTAEVLKEMGYEVGPQHRENGERVRRYIKVVTGSDGGGDTQTPSAQADIPMSQPSQPITSHTQERAGADHEAIAGDEFGRDGCDVVTPGFGDWLKTEGIGGGE